MHCENKDETNQPNRMAMTHTMKMELLERTGKGGNGYEKTEDGETEDRRQKTRW